MQLANKPWIQALQERLLITNEVSTNEMAKIWDVTARTARTRLNKLLEESYLKRKAKSKHDPHATFTKQ
jgi:Fic family protein